MFWTNVAERDTYLSETPPVLVAYETYQSITAWYAAYARRRVAPFYPYLTGEDKQCSQPLEHRDLLSVNS